MRAMDVMSRPVLTVRADTSVEQATALLIAHNIAAAPVLDETGDLVGMVSEGDLLRGRIARPGGTARVAAGVRPAVVADVMTTNVVVMPPDADLADIAEAMLYNDVRSVPVVDDQSNLAGIVSRRDVLRTVVRTDETVALEVQERLDEYAAGARRWSVSVVDGTVTVMGAFADEAEAKIVAVLARSLPGVLGVRLRPRPS